MRFPILCVALVAIAAPVAAAQTDWQEVLPDVRMRLVAMPYYGAGHDIAAAIEIDMPVTHKTYWRIAGAAGFPAEIHLEGSRNVVAHQQTWPLPTVEVFNGETDYVYRGHSFLPFDVTPVKGSEVDVEVSAFLGICAELCMPVSVKFSMPLDRTSSDTLDAFAMALSAIPVPWPNGDSPLHDVHAVDGGLALTIAPDVDVDASTLVAATIDGKAFGASRGGSEIVLPMAVGGPVVTGDIVTIAFRAGPGTYSVEVRIP